MSDVESRHSAEQLAAVERWLELGSSSATNPVLGFALQEFLQPLGIQGAWIEFVLTTANALPSVKPRLYGARMIPPAGDAVDDELDQALAVLARHANAFRLTVGIYGKVTVERISDADPSDILWPKIVDAVATLDSRVAEAFRYMTVFLLRVSAVLGSEGSEWREIQALLAAGRTEEFCRAVLEARMKG